MLDYPRALASSPVLSRSRPTHASRTSTSLSVKRGSYQLVPQRAYSTHFGVSQGKVIPFQLVGAKEPGVPMRMLINEDAVDAPIVGPHDLPFDETVPSTITLRIWVSNCFTSVCVTYSFFIFLLSGPDMRYTQDGEAPCSPVFVSLESNLPHSRLTMRKASGLLNRIELAMCLTECFRNFIEVCLSHF